MTNILITVDTEAHRDLSEFWGCSQKGSYGIEKICRIFNDFDIRATFFLDVGEITKWGEKELKAVTDCLKASGNEIQLHVHPNYLGDPSKYYFWQYALLKQSEIIREAKKIFEEIVGYSPQAFRAGSYGANDETLHALALAGISLDFSAYFEKKNCKMLLPAGNCPNDVYYQSGVYEIPVSTFGLNLFGLRYRSKVDINSSATSELINVIELMTTNDYNPIIMFMHSFSLADRGRKYLPDFKAEEKLKRVLDYLKRTEIPVSTISEYADSSLPVVDIKKQEDKNSFVVKHNADISLNGLIKSFPGTFHRVKGTGIAYSIKRLKGMIKKGG